MARIGNTYIGDEIGMGACKGVADLNWISRIICTMKEQEGYVRLWQIELIERIEIEAAA